MFRAPAMLLPHESTVAHEQTFVLESPLASVAEDTSSKHKVIFIKVLTMQSYFLNVYKN